jgi:hypothetical protein
MYRILFVHGMIKKKKSCVDTIIRRSTERHLYCLLGLGAHCGRSKRIDEHPTDVSSLNLYTIQASHINSFVQLISSTRRDEKRQLKDESLEDVGAPCSSDLRYNEIVTMKLQIKALRFVILLRFQDVVPRSSEICTNNTHSPLPQCKQSRLRTNRTNIRSRQIIYKSAQPAAWIPFEETNSSKTSSASWLILILLVWIVKIFFLVF